MLAHGVSHGMCAVAVSPGTGRKSLPVSRVPLPELPFAPFRGLAKGHAFPMARAMGYDLAPLSGLVQRD
jgi:hypothetical protein